MTGFHCSGVSVTSARDKRGSGAAEQSESVSLSDQTTVLTGITVEHTVCYGLSASRPMTNSCSNRVHAVTERVLCTVSSSFHSEALAM